jgi:NAD-dependent SIR2 family protein deacetylase
VSHLEALADLVGDGGVVVLSGAGLSTESGIPDYRGPSGLARRATPMSLQTFTGSREARQRYWARSHLGWGLIRSAQPNHGHRAVAALEGRGLLAGILTQNVDGLHQSAGARDVLELHGNLQRVVCLDCSDVTSRVELDRRLRAANLGWRAQATAINPDGDVELADVSGFRVVDCSVCGGVLKPDVVFFGENVPRDRVQQAFALVESAGSLLVLGSSLTVMSGYRFVLRAAKLGVPVAIVNEGTTRGDAQARVKVSGRLGEVLPSLLGYLTDQASGRDCMA